MYKNELWVVVSADFDDISDRTFVISRRTFALLIESVHLHLLLCHNSHGHLILHISPCVLRDPDRARSHALTSTVQDPLVVAFKHARKLMNFRLTDRLTGYRPDKQQIDG